MSGLQCKQHQKEYGNKQEGDDDDKKGFFNGFGGQVPLKDFDTFAALSRARRYPATTLAEVVFITPPVEPGDAPINVNRIIINIDACERIPRFTVLKPAVRTVTD